MNEEQEQNQEDKINDNGLAPAVEAQETSSPEASSSIPDSLPKHCLSLV